MVYLEITKPMVQIHFCTANNVYLLIVFIVIVLYF